MKVSSVGLSSVVVAFAEGSVVGSVVLKQDDKVVPHKKISSADAQQISIEFHLKDFSVYKDLIVSSDSGEFNLYDCFAKYRLDQSKLADEFYVTRTLINAATRGLDDSELYFVAYNALGVMPETNHFYGALITLVSYKYLEVPEYRGWVLDILFESKKKYDAAVVEYTPNIVRWGVSSATALSLALLLNDRVDQAEALVDTVLTSYDPNFNQLTHWNYCQCLLMKSTILFYMGRPKEAGWKYLAAFDYSRKALNDTYHSRNDWVLNQILDCHALLNLGELALKCAAKIFGTLPPASRYADVKYSGGVSFMPMFSRFHDSRSKFKSSFFDDVEKRFSVSGVVVD